jgi:hypothetical protein
MSDPLPSRPSFDAKKPARICRSIADEGKFDVHGRDVGSDANKAADRLYDELVKAKEMLLAPVHSQISI